MPRPLSLLVSLSLLTACATTVAPDAGQSTLPLTSSSADKVAAMDMAKTVAYENEAFGLAFEYPESWGQPVIEKMEGISDEDLEVAQAVSYNEENQPTLTQTPFDLAGTNFDSKISFPVLTDKCSALADNEWCSVYVGIKSFSTADRYEVNCIEGGCIKKDLFAERTFVEESTNATIGGLPAYTRDYFFRGGIHNRSYTFFQGDTKFVLVGTYTTTTELNDGCVSQENGNLFVPTAFAAGCAEETPVDVWSDSFIDELVVLNPQHEMFAAFYWAFEDVALSVQIDD
jgi:hypothetical protein